MYLKFICFNIFIFFLVKIGDDVLVVFFVMFCCLNLSDIDILIVGFELFIVLEDWRLRLGDSRGKSCLIIVGMVSVCWLLRRF